MSNEHRTDVHVLFNIGPLGPRVCYWRGDVPRTGSLPTIRKGSTAILNKHKGAWLGPATVLAQEMSRSQEQHEKVHGAVWIVVQGRLLRCAPEHLRHLSERESLSNDGDKRRQGESWNVHGHVVQDFRFSKGTHADLRSQHDPPARFRATTPQWKDFCEKANIDAVERVQVE